MSGKESDNSCNYGVRSYFIKYKNDTNDPVKTELHLCKAIKSTISGFEKTTKNMADIENVNRIQVFRNEEDPYFSVVVGFKLSSDIKTCIQPNMVRFWVALEAHANGVYTIYTNIYKTHEACGSWDERHCLEAPIIDNRLKNAQRYYESCIKTINESEGKGGEE